VFDNVEEAIPSGISYRRANTRPSHLLSRPRNANAAECRRDQSRGVYADRLYARQLKREILESSASVVRTARRKGRSRSRIAKNRRPFSTANDLRTIWQRKSCRELAPRPRSARRNVDRPSGGGQRIHRVLQRHSVVR